MKRAWVFLALALAFNVLACSIVFGHDDRGQSDWIGDGKYTSKNGGPCCGKNDCEPLSQEDVEPRIDGIWIPRYKELVPYNEATPSEDEHSYRCRNAAGWRTCFFFKYGAS